MVILLQPVVSASAFLLQQLPVLRVTPIELLHRRWQHGYVRLAITLSSFDCGITQEQEVTIHSCGGMVLAEVVSPSMKRN
jgi:hypothetical protein